MNENKKQRDFWKLFSNVKYERLVKKIKDSKDLEAFITIIENLSEYDYEQLVCNQHRTALRLGLQKYRSEIGNLVNLINIHNDCEQISDEKEVLLNHMDENGVLISEPLEIQKALDILLLQARELQINKTTGSTQPDEQNNESSEFVENNPVIAPRQNVANEIKAAQDLLCKFTEEYATRATAYQNAKREMKREKKLFEGGTAFHNATKRYLTARADLAVMKKILEKGYKLFEEMKIDFLSSEELRNYDAVSLSEKYAHLFDNLLPNNSMHKVMDPSPLPDLESGYIKRSE